MMDPHHAYGFQTSQPFSLFCPAVADSMAWSNLGAANGAHVTVPIVPMGHRLPPAMPPLHHATSMNNESTAPPNANNNNNNASNATAGDGGHSSSCGAESPVAENEGFLPTTQAPLGPAATPLLPDHIGLISRLPPTTAINLAHHANAPPDIQAGSVEAAAAAAVAVAAELSAAQAAHYHTHVHHFHRNHMTPAALSQTGYISVVRPDIFHPDIISAAAALQPFHPYYLPAPLARHAGRFDDYLRNFYGPHRHAPPPNRGASKTTIERNTFAHKYKRMKKTIEEERDDDVEKCTICLYEFEVEEDVR